MQYEQLINDFIDYKKKCGLSDLTLKLFRNRITWMLEKVNGEITEYKLHKALYFITSDKELHVYAWQMYYTVLKQFIEWYCTYRLKNSILIRL